MLRRRVGRVLQYALMSDVHSRMIAVHLLRVIESPLPLSVKVAVRDIAEYLLTFVWKAMADLLTAKGSPQKTELFKICLPVLKQLVGT